MLDLKKLQEKLDLALAKETDESLLAWHEQYIKKQKPMNKETL